MIYIGIDPGKNGGFAVIDVEVSHTLTFSRPMDGKDYVEWMRALTNLHPAEELRCCLEKVGAMPGQGVSSTFTFGEGFGFVQGVLTALGIPFQLVPPQKWKKEFSLNSDKQKSIEVCQRLFPDINLYRTDRCKKPHDGMAEALLMAEYARRKL